MSEDPQGKLHGLDPGELLARALKSEPVAGHAARWTPPTLEEIAQLLPQYRIEALLGHGGMGAVYKGWQATIERAVAIKLLPAEMAANEDFVNRFVREARTLAHLQHPGIVSVYDFGQTSEGHLYFVMEFVEGTDLHQVLRGPHLPPAQAVAFIGQICEALQYAHTQGVIHRDIKPANILLTTDGRVKVADFGLARPLRSQDSDLTQTNVIMGTPGYMAPEQRFGQADHRADIFALGVMFYEMLTGQLPQGAFPPPSQSVQVDVRMDQVVLKALQTEPDRRYQQASEMKAAVERASTPVEAPPPAPRLSRLLRSRGLLINVAALLAAAILGGLLVWKAAQRSPTADQNPSSPATPATASEAHSTTPEAATKDAPFLNDLGMKFVPVPIVGGATSGQRVLFSIWETRVQDYAVFTRETDRAWRRPNHAQSPLHPVTFIEWKDATAFCAWLTARERAVKKIPDGWSYRLPSDHEWSCAVGIGPLEDAALTPQAKNERVKKYPWGNAWPPPAGAGNFADLTARAQNVRGDRNCIEGYDDGFAYTAPVGSFPPNSLGLYDLSGNAWERVEDWYDEKHEGHAVRGSSFMDFLPFSPLSSHREPGVGVSPPLDRVGFRCVLARDDSPRATPPAAVATPTPRPTTPTPAPATPAPTLSGSPRPLDTAGLEQIVDVDFRQGLNTYPAVKEPKWTTGLLNGEFQMICRDPGVWWVSQPVLHQLHVEDFVCEVRGRIAHSAPKDGWGLGVEPRRGPDSPWAGVGINGEGRIYSHDAGRDTPWVSSPTLHRGTEACTLRVEGIGQRLRVFVDGQFVFDHEAQAIKPDADLTVYCFGGNPPQDIRLSTIKVWVPKKGAPISLSGTPAPVTTAFPALGANGRPLNLGFEDGTLKDWTATGDAWKGQPIRGDTVAQRRTDVKSRHAGNFWIGGYEVVGDEGKGRLTSVPFQVLKPWASFLVGGGGGEDGSAYVEIVDAATGRSILTARGADTEELKRVAVDLHLFVGKQIFIRLVDESTDGWGHVNFDDFYFHDTMPGTEIRPASP